MGEGGGESRKSRSFKGLRSAKGGERDSRSLRNTRLKVLTKKPNSHVPGRRLECSGVEVHLEAAEVRVQRRGEVLVHHVAQAALPRRLLLREPSASPCRCPCSRQSRS